MNFFGHENQGCPPSLSDQGNLRLPKKKSELTECLQALTVPQSQMPRNVDVIIIDGAAVVKMVKPDTERTFSEYAADSFIPYIRAQLSHVTRLEIVWDDYLKNSLKATTRGKRGTGVRQRVAADNKLPRNWQEFLRVDQNKQELFKYLAECITSIDAEKQVISTHGKQVLSIMPIHVTTSDDWPLVTMKKPILECSFMWQMQHSVASRRSSCALLILMFLFWPSLL